MLFNFSKFHGFGNDYIVVDADDIRGVDVSALGVSMCDRHTGVGSDGIALVEKLDGADADWSCRIINPDGSEGSFSGNGTRCAVSHLYHFGLWKSDSLRLTTLSGVKKYELIGREPSTYWFKAEIGQPKFSPREIPFVSDSETAFDHPVDIEGKEYRVTALNVGNPAGVIFVDDFDFDWRSVGKSLEVHPMFPERTNAVFAQVLDGSNLEIRIWERGASETSSSGTCSIAAAVSAAVTGRAGRKVSVHAVGGTTETEWRESDGEMLLTGRADFVCRGEYWVGSK
jgi:diaminopimelate epimerase